MTDPEARAKVLTEIHDERIAQDAKWGEQDHPDGTGIGALSGRWSFAADDQRARTQERAWEGRCAWSDILAEEVAEAFAEIDEHALRLELIQVAAVAAQWIEAIDRRLAS